MLDTFPQPIGYITKVYLLHWAKNMPDIFLGGVVNFMQYIEFIE